MPRKTKPITLVPTPEFRKWFEAYREKWGFKTEGEALAYLASDTAAAEGFEGEIMNLRGTYDRELARLMKLADEATDMGKYDPAEMEYVFECVYCRHQQYTNGECEKCDESEFKQVIKPIERE